jgi:hypothetical protein
MKQKDAICDDFFRGIPDVPTTDKEAFSLEFDDLSEIMKSKMFNLILLFTS